MILWGFTSKQELTFLDDLSPICEPISLESNADIEADAAAGGGAAAIGRRLRSRGTKRRRSRRWRDGELGEDELGDSEFMLYELDSSGRVELSNNVIRLSAGDDVFEKLAISFAFAQSAKLAVFEHALEATTAQIRPIPRMLVKDGRCSFSVNEVARLTGRIFLERNAVNLYSNILDTPDFFWEAEAFEPLYRRVNKYLDIEDRVQILNKRLDIVNDLLDSLSSQLEIRNSHRLEVIIILLITLEIALEVVKEAMLPPLATWPRKLIFAGGAALLVPWRRALNRWL